MVSLAQLFIHTTPLASIILLVYIIMKLNAIEETFYSATSQTEHSTKLSKKNRVLLIIISLVVACPILVSLLGSLVNAFALYR